MTDTLQGIEFKKRTIVILVQKTHQATAERLKIAGKTLVDNDQM